LRLWIGNKMRCALCNDEFEGMGHNVFEYLGREGQCCKLCYEMFILKNISKISYQLKERR